jgi:hypothetical protein
LTSKVNPPHDREAEAAVLGAILLGAQLPSNLRAFDFYLEPHRLTYGAITELAERNVSADPVSVRHLLEEKGNVEAVGGVSFISSLTDASPDVVNVDHWAEIIRDFARKRTLRSIGHDLLNPNGKRSHEMIQEALGQLRVLSQEGDEGGPAGPVWRTVREYLDNPELMQPPEEVVSNLAWRGRVTLLAAREKAGKSTYVAFGTALLSRSQSSKVLWVNLEEAAYDVVDRFKTFDAHSERIVVSEFLPNKLADLEAAIREHSPDLVVIDALVDWGADQVTDWNSAAQVTPVMRDLVSLARRHRVALVIIHHGKKTDGSYRDSTAIGASVDVIIEMSTDNQDDHVRHFKPKARWTVEPFSLRWTGTIYESVGGELSILERVYQFIRTHPGCSKNEIRKKVKGKATTIDRAIESLTRACRIEDRGDETGSRYFTSNDGASGTLRTLTGHGRDTPSKIPKGFNGTLEGHSKDTPRDTPPVSHPLKWGCGDTVQGGLRSGEEVQESNANIEDFQPVVRNEVNRGPKAAKPGLPEHSRDWPKPLQKRLRELVGQGHRRIPATEMVRKEYEEGL